MNYAWHVKHNILVQICFIRVSTVAHWLFCYKRWWIFSLYLHSFGDLYCVLGSVVSFPSSSPFNFSTQGIHSNLLIISLFFSISFPGLKYPCHIKEGKQLLKMCLLFSVIFLIRWTLLQNNPYNCSKSLNNVVKTTAFLKLHAGITSELANSSAILQIHWNSSAIICIVTHSSKV